MTSIYGCSISRVAVSNVDKSLTARANRPRRRPAGATCTPRLRSLSAGWLSGASHPRIPEFVAAARTIRRHKELIGNTYRTSRPSTIKPHPRKRQEILTAKDRQSPGRHSAEFTCG